jgi:hypothetical protein
VSRARSPTEGADRRRAVINVTTNKTSVGIRHAEDCEVFKAELQKFKRGGQPMWRFPRVLIIAAALVAFGQVMPAGADGPKTIVGAWLTNVTPTLQPAFVGLGTFNSDGTLTNTTSAALAFPTETPGHGAWVRTGRHTFAVTFVALIGDAAGSIFATAKVRATLTIGESGDEFTGVFRIDLIDPSGVLIVSDTGTVHGTRIKVEPL